LKVHSSKPAQAKSSVKPHLNGKKVGMVVRAYLLSEGKEHKIEGPHFGSFWAKSETSISKITRAEKDGSMVQACLNSNPNTGPPPITRFQICKSYRDYKKRQSLLVLLCFLFRVY
jgi:hypothetical protein